MADDENCPDCDGTGKITKETSTPCKNCEGAGSMAAGRGNRYVCSVCNGEGEKVDSKQIPCPKCKGSGLGPKVGATVVGKKKVDEPAKKVVEKAKKPVAPAAGTTRDDESDDVEVGNGRDNTQSQPKNKPAPAAVRASGNENASTETRRGITWEPGVGLVVNVVVGSSCLMNGSGIILTIVGFLLLLASSIFVMLLGVILFVAGLSLLYLANRSKIQQFCPGLAQAMQAAQATGASGASQTGGARQ